MSSLLLDTSGFSFEDWRGTVYPETLPKPQWLIYYEQRLGLAALEVNYQFPGQFTRTAARQAYLERVMDRLADVPLVVEFRHDSWVDAAVTDRMRARGVGCCAVDEPSLAGLMPWRPEATGPLADARFHGRNAAAWFGTSTAERYDYPYRDAELRELVGRLEPMRRAGVPTLAFFNNCHAGAAARNALQFRALAAAAGWTVAGAGPVPALFPEARVG